MMRSRRITAQLENERKKVLLVVFRRYGGWFACTIAAIVVWICLHFCLQITNDNGARYLLSAISQGLAAILALVFTITLIAAQMTRRYTAMDRMFKRETVLLMLIFAIGIVLPLIILKTGRSIYVNECIALAAFCVLSLIPHLKGVNTTLKYDVGIDNLGEELMDAIESERETTAINRISDLGQIGADASEDMEKEATEDVVRLLKVVGNKSAGKKFENTTYQAVDSLSEVGKRAAENNWKRVTRSNTIVGLMSIGDRSIENRWEYVILSVIDGLISIGVISAKKEWRGVIYNVSSYLTKVGVKFGWEEVGRNSASGLWILGASVTKYLVEVVDYLTNELRKLESSEGNDFLEEASVRAREDINERYPDLKPSFEEFKRRYYE